MKRLYINYMNIIKSNEMNLYKTYEINSIKKVTIPLFSAYYTYLFIPFII